MLVLKTIRMVLHPSADALGIIWIIPYIVLPIETGSCVALHNEVSENMSSC